MGTGVKTLERAQGAHVAHDDVVALPRDARVVVARAKDLVPQPLVLRRREVAPRERERLPSLSQLPVFHALGERFFDERRVGDLELSLQELRERDARAPGRVRQRRYRVDDLVEDGLRRRHGGRFAGGRVAGSAVGSRTRARFEVRSSTESIRRSSRERLHSSLSHTTTVLRPLSPELA